VIAGDTKRHEIVAELGWAGGRSTGRFLLGMTAAGSGNSAPMARALWTGSVSFGLVNIPVRMFTAQHDHEVSFHQLSKRSGNRVRYRKVDERTGRELDADDIVKGYEVANGKWVTFDDDELDELRPESTRTIEIEDFVDLAEIDPIYFERTYYLGPEDNAGAKKAYALLQAAMKDRERAAIGRVVMRNRQYLAAIRPLDSVLALSTMRFADEVVGPRDIEDLRVGRVTVDAKSRRLATSLIDSLATSFDPARYHDTYTEVLRDLIEKKAAGETIEPAPARERDDGKVTDLMAALEASLERKRGTSRRSGSARSTASKARTSKGRSSKARTSKASARKPAGSRRRAA
jgi:DNA end-binding protein Ku